MTVVFVVAQQAERTCRRTSLPGAGFQLVDQRFDLAAMIANEGIVFRPPGQDHADAAHLDVDNARALAVVRLALLHSALHI